MYRYYTKYTTNILMRPRLRVYLSVYRVIPVTQYTCNNKQTIVVFTSKYKVWYVRRHV